MASTWSDDEKDLSISEIFQRAIDYWTPERIKNSVPFDEDSIDSNENNAGDPMESMLTCTEKLALGKKQHEAQPRINTDLGLTHQNSICSDSSDQAEELPREIPNSTSSSDEMPLASQPRASLDQDSDGKTTTEAPPSTEGDQAAPAAAKSEIPAAAKGKIPAASRSARIDQKDLDLKTLPCQSVGKIHCAIKPKSGEDIDVIAHDKYVTAFYIGQPTQTNGEPVERLLTVAHVFDDRSFRNTKYHIFVPASNADASNKDEMYLIHPRMKRVSPKAYCLKKYANDICVVFIIPNPLKSIIGPGRPISRTLSPLQLVVKNDYGTNDSWRVIGYPSKSCGMKISAYDGNFIQAHTLSNYEPLTIQMNNDALLGMSGGPWILHDSDNRVNGIQSGLVKQPDAAASGRPRKGHNFLSQLHCNAVSPFFRKELLEELDLDYQTIL